MSDGEEGSAAAKRRKKRMKRRGKCNNHLSINVQEILFMAPTSNYHDHQVKEMPINLDSAGPLSPRAAAALKQEIEKERAQLMATKDMAESEKNKAQDELTKREVELKSAQEQHEELNKKLQDLQSKVTYMKSLGLDPNYGVYQRITYTLRPYKTAIYNRTYIFFR